MARQLIDQMTADWRPQAYEDDFTNAIRTLVPRPRPARRRAWSPWRWPPSTTAATWWT